MIAGDFKKEDGGSFGTKVLTFTYLNGSCSSLYRQGTQLNEPSRLFSRRKTEEHVTLVDGEHAKRIEHKGHMGFEASKMREDVG